MAAAFRFEDGARGRRVGGSAFSSGPVRGRCGVFRSLRRPSRRAPILCLSVYKNHKKNTIPLPRFGSLPFPAPRPGERRRFSISANRLISLSFSCFLYFCGFAPPADAKKEAAARRPGNAGLFFTRSHGFFGGESSAAQGVLPCGSKAHRRSRRRDQSSFFSSSRVSENSATVSSTGWGEAISTPASRSSSMGCWLLPPERNFL